MTIRVAAAQLSWDNLSAKAKMLRILAAIRDPVCFCEDKYFLNVKLRPVQKKIIREFYEKDEHGVYKYNEGICVAGMRSGKTFIAACIALYEAFLLTLHPDPAVKWDLAQGSKIFIVNVAPQGTQSKETVFAEIVQRIKYSPYFLTFIDTSPKKDIFTDNIYIRSKNIVFRAFGSASTSSVGRTVKLVVFDELAKFEEQERGKQDVDAVYSSLTSSTLTFGREGRRFGIGSLRHSTDKLNRLYEAATAVDHEGKKMHERMIGWKYTSREMNPTLSKREIEERMKTDPSGTMRDFFNVTTGIGGDYYVDKRIIRTDNKMSNKLEIVMELMEKHLKTHICAEEAVEDTLYADWDKMSDALIAPANEHDDWFKGRVMGVDPSVSNDAFGMAVGYVRARKPIETILSTGDTDIDYRINRTEIVLDGLWRFVPDIEVGELNEQKITMALTTAAKFLNVKMAIFDQWSHPHAQGALKRMGVHVEEIRGKAEKNARVKFRQMFGSLRMCPYDVIVKEMKELITKPGGRVDHPRGGTKDVYDAGVQVVWGIDEIIPLLSRSSPIVLDGTKWSPILVA